MSPDNPAPRATIDERLHAIVETLELVASMHRDHEKQLAEADRRWTERFEKVMNGLERLTSVAESHERRITGLEGI